ncbi:MAG: hypothetical protein PVI30_19075 [Myxococcales bacterium]|jgi:hypothetical protein
MSRRRSKAKKRGTSPSHDEGMLFDDPEHDFDSGADLEWSDDAMGDEPLEESFGDYDDELPFSPSRRRAQGYRDVDDWS